MTAIQAGSVSKIAGRLRSVSLVLAIGAAFAAPIVSGDWGAAFAAPIVFPLSPAKAAQAQAIPDFSGFWTRSGENASTFDVPQGVPHAIDTAVPHHGHTDDVASNAWIADTTNPILLPWTRDVLEKYNASELKGDTHLSGQQICELNGVPQVINLRNHVQFLQSADVVVVIYGQDMQVRRIYLNRPHSAQVAPSWYGESVGHYEGDTLVVDTIGFNDKTDIDRFGTPHTTKLHVVERYKMADLNTLHVDFTVEDPGAFTMTWAGAAGYRRTQGTLGAIGEFVCAENNREFAGQKFNIPTATQADF